MGSFKKTFHGSYIVAVCFVLSLLFGGLVRTLSWTLGSYMGEEAEWSRSAVSIATAAILIPMLFMPLFIGWLVDRIGSKKLMLFGCLLSGSGMMLFAGMSQLWHYTVLSFCIVAGTAAATGIPIYALLLRWFRRNRGLAIALAAMGASIGHEIPTIAKFYLQGSLGWRWSSALIGFVALTITIPLILRFIKDRPSEMGLHPDGIEPDEGEPTEPMGHTLEEAFRSPTFWHIAGALLLVNMLSAVPIMALLVSNLLASGASIASAMTIGGTLKRVSFLSLPLIGLLADRRGAGWTFIFIVFLAALGVGVLSVTPASWILVVFPLLQIMCVSGIGILVPIIIVERHGLSRFGIIYAVITLLGGLGVAVGGLSFSGLVFDQTSDSSFNSMIYIRAVLASQIIFLLLSAYLMRKAKPPAKTQPATAETN